MRNLRLTPDILNEYQLCLQKYKYGILDNIGLPSVPDTPPKQGQLMHLMLEAWYKAKIDQIPYPVAMPEIMNFTRFHIASGRAEISVEVGEKVIWAFREYTDYWQHEQWIPLHAELPFSVEVYRQEDTPQKEGLRILFEGRPDLIIKKKDVERPIGVDHKLSFKRAEPSSLSNQFAGYPTFLNLDTMIVNKIGMQKSVPTSEKMQRYEMHYSPAFRAEFRHNAIMWARDVDKKVQKALKTNFWMKNFTSCDKWSGCAFQDLCQEDSIMRAPLIKNMYIKKEPYDSFKEPRLEWKDGKLHLPEKVKANGNQEVITHS